MDGTRFDWLARAVGTDGTRRRLFSLGALSLAGLVLALADEDGEAKRQHGRNRGHRPGKGKRTGSAGDGEERCSR